MNIERIEEIKKEVRDYMTRHHFVVGEYNDLTRDMECANYERMAKLLMCVNILQEENEQIRNQGEHTDTK